MTRTPLLRYKPAGYMPELHIRRAANGGARLDIVWSYEPDGLTTQINTSDVDRVVAALYEAAGRDVIILDRRPVDPDRVQHGHIVATPPSVRTLTPAQARAFAAEYASAADVAAGHHPDPDLEQVHALAAAIAAERGQEQPDPTVLEFARTAVRAGYRQFVP